MLISALFALSWLADSATTELTTATTSATAAQGPGDDTKTIGAEYVVPPDIHPRERIQKWTEQIEKNNGTNAIDFMNRGVAFQEQGSNEETEPQMIDQRRKEAEVDYHKSMELNPANPSVHYNLGNLKRMQSRWAEAANAFKQANQHAPDNFHPMAMTGLANAYTKLNLHAEAVEAYDKVISKTPTDTRAKLLRGKAHAGHQDTEKALVDFSTGINELKDKAKASSNGLSSDDKKLLATAHFERGSVYLKDPSEDAQRSACKDFTRALKGITKPVRAPLGDIANTRKLRSECRRATENYKGAVDDLSKSIELVEAMNFKIFPEPGWFAIRGRCREKLGEVDAALKDYARTVEIKPSEGAAWTSMGQIYQEREEWPEAVEAYTHRIEIRTARTGGDKQHVARAHLNRGFCLERAGERELALADYIESCELNHKLGCQNQKVLEADGVVAKPLAKSKGKGGSSRWSVTGATTTVTTAAGTVHVPTSVKANRDDL